MKTKSSFAGSSAGSPARWLVVDDNEDVLALMREIIAQIANAEVECFNTARAAVSAFAAAPESFGLVLTDLEMPEMCGIELCRRLHTVSPRLKILLATGNGIINEEEAGQRGFCGLLHKPFSPAALREAVKAAGMSNAADDGNHWQKKSFAGHATALAAA
jgi:CheY-like chemotaxis protein